MGIDIKATATGMIAGSAEYTPLVIPERSMVDQSKELAVPTSPLSKLYITLSPFHRIDFMNLQHITNKSNMVIPISTEVVTRCCSYACS